MISQPISWHLRIGMARIGGARCQALPITNVLGTCVQLNGDGLDPVHGLVAVAAARVVHSCRFVVIEKSRLAAAIAAGCAAKSGSNMKLPH
jgi:hypothetical protein